MSPGDGAKYLKLVIICVKQMLLGHSRKESRESSRCTEDEEEDGD